MRRAPLLLSLFIATSLALTGCESEPDSDEPAQQQADEQPDEQPDEQSDGDDSVDEDSDEEQELADDIDPGEEHHFGDEFTIDDEPTRVSEALVALEETGDDELSDPVKVYGQIEQVCSSRGCWFTLTDDELDLTARVRMEDYGFFVPRNADGADAVLEGTVQRTTVDEEQARHYAEKAGDDPDAIDGDVDEFEFTATGVTVTAPDS